MNDLHTTASITINRNVLPKHMIDTKFRTAPGTPEDLRFAIIDVYVGGSEPFKKKIVGVFKNSKGELVYGGYFSNTGIYHAKAKAGIYSSKIKKVLPYLFSEPHNLTYIS